jgi:hypothetical protein
MVRVFYCAGCNEWGQRFRDGCRKCRRGYFKHGKCGNLVTAQYGFCPRCYPKRLEKLLHPQTQTRIRTRTQNKTRNTYTYNYMVEKHDCWFVKDTVLGGYTCPQCSSHKEYSPSMFKDTYTDTYSDTHNDPQKCQTCGKRTLDVDPSSQMCAKCRLAVFENEGKPLPSIGSPLSRFNNTF